MNLSGKNIKYIIIGAIVLVVIYYFFFKKKADASKVVAGRNAGKAVDLALQPRAVAPAEEEDIQALGTDPTVDPEAKIELGYVGPQDCAENCGSTYDRMIVSCYENGGLQNCLNRAELFKQKCLMKCDNSLPSHMNIENRMNTPIQEDNYVTALQNIIGSKGYV